MATRRATASEVRESIEAKTGDNDIEMKDGSDEDAEGDIDMDAEGEVDAAGETDDDGHPDMFRTIHNLSTYLCNVDEE